MTDKAIYTDAIASKNKPYNEVSGAAQLTGLEFCINIIRNVKSCYIYFTTQCTVVYRYVHLCMCTVVNSRVYTCVQESVHFCARKCTVLKQTDRLCTSAGVEL